MERAIEMLSKYQAQVSQNLSMNNDERTNLCLEIEDAILDVQKAMVALNGVDRFAFDSLDEAKKANHFEITDDFVFGWMMARLTLEESLRLQALGEKKAIEELEKKYGHRFREF